MKARDEAGRYVHRRAAYPQLVHKFSTMDPDMLFDALASMYNGANVSPCIDCGVPSHNKRCMKCDNAFRNRLAKERKQRC